MSVPEEEAPRRYESREERLRFILDGQRHCDHYLRALAIPAGKRVLVAGAGAGTEMLWCLRHGAREVVGVDLAPQDPAALAAATERLGLTAPHTLLEMSIEEVAKLGRRFDLVLSNNVFEHVRRLDEAFAACAAVLEPGGRLALFTAPLYYSSHGAHLPAEPWEHLWTGPEALRQRLLAAGELPPWHALRELTMEDYLGREISLNRARLGDLLAAVARSGLVLLGLRILRDRRLAELPRYLERLRALLPTDRAGVADFGLEGVAIELAAVAPGAAMAGPLESTAEFVEWQDRRGQEEEIGRLRAELEGLRGEVDGVAAVLRSVETSWSFRLGRLVTGPARAVRDALRLRRSRR